jgi:DNA polymerase alpha-associated DNA helicase A
MKAKRRLYAFVLLQARLLASMVPLEYVVGRCQGTDIDIT